MADGNRVIVDTDSAEDAQKILEAIEDAVERDEITFPWSAFTTRHPK